MTRLLSLVVTILLAACSPASKAVVDPGVQPVLSLAGKGPDLTGSVWTGTLVFLRQFPHVIFACTSQVVVPWDQIEPFLSNKGKAVGKSLAK